MLQPIDYFVGLRWALFQRTEKLCSPSLCWLLLVTVCHASAAAAVCKLGTKVKLRRQVRCDSGPVGQDTEHTPAARGGNGSINYYSASASPHPSRTLQEFSHLLISNFVLCVELYLVYLVSQAISGICLQHCLLYVCLVNKVVWTIFPEYTFVNW